MRLRVSDYGGNGGNVATVKLRDPEAGWSADRLDSCSARRCDPLREPSCAAKSRQKPGQRSLSIRCVQGSCCPHSAGLHAAGPDRGRWVNRFVNKAHLHRGKTARAGRKDDSARDETQRNLFAIHIENETASQFCAAGSHVADNCRGIRIDRGCRNIRLLQFLIGGNLRQIDEVPDD